MAVNNPVFIAIAILLASALLLILNRRYHKLIERANPAPFLFLGYILLAVNIFLSPKFYSVEWAFLGFILIFVLFYDFKIDSRFFILPALLLLGYVPFLLIGKMDAIAENIAIFVYYFLVAGVVLQLIEHVKSIENSISFEGFIKEFLKSQKLISFLLIFSGLVGVSLIIANRFFELEFFKWSSVYLFFVMLIAYILSANKSWLEERQEIQTIQK